MKNILLNIENDDEQDKKAEELLKSTNLDDIVLGLRIIKHPKERYYTSYQGDAIVIFDDATFDICVGRIYKYGNLIFTQVEWKMYERIGYEIRDFRENTITYE